MTGLVFLLTLVTLVGIVAGYLYLARQALTKAFGPDKTIGPLLSPKGIRAERAARRARVARGRLEPIEAPSKPAAKPAAAKTKSKAKKSKSASSKTTK